MKLPPRLQLKPAALAVILLFGIVAVVLFSRRHPPASNEAPPANPSPHATSTEPPGTNAVAAEMTEGTNAPSTATATVLATAVTNAAPTNAEAKAAQAAVTNGPPVAPATSGPAAATAGKSPADEEIQLSFQGANVDVVVQWLAKNTGKSVVKHPRVQCQLTIVSSKPMAVRDAVNLVYRALALEGFTTVESSNSILIVPEGQEPKLSPELIDAAHSDVPEGRQRLVKIFTLQHIDPAELKGKIQAVLTDKATIEISDRSNQIIVTDYTDNIRLLGELIKELDVASPSDVTIELYSLKHTEADDMATLLAMVLNAQAPPPGSSSRSSPSSSSSSSPSPIMIGSSPPPMPHPSSSSSSSGGSQGNGSQPIKIWPDRNFNRLIVAAPKAKLKEIKDLIEMLDTEKPQDVGLRVIPLKNMDAQDLVKDVGPLYQKLSGQSLKDTIQIAASTRSNTLIVLSSEANFKSIEELITTLDTEDAQERVMQAFPLKNADAEDVAKQLQDLNQEPSSYPRYFYVFSSSGNSRDNKKMSVVADRRRNTVIVQAAPSSMENIAKMIAALDEPITDDSLAPKIFRLKYVSASDIEDVLNELFLKKTQRRSYWDYYEGNDEVADKNVGRLYGKVRITSEPYSNTIIVTSNSPENLSAVEDVLKQLDVPSQAGDTTLRVGLNFAQAVEVANSMNVLFAKPGSPPLRANPQPGAPNDNRGQNQPATTTQTGFELEKETREEAYYPWLGGQQENSRTSDGRTTVRQVSDLVGRVRVVPDRRSNSLLITSSVHFFPQVLKLINDMDAPTAQVLIEAKIVEVSSDFRDKLGVRWSPDGTRVFDEEDLDDSVRVNAGATYSKVFAGSAMANALHTGILDSSVNLDFLIQFLRKNSDSKILAEPQINIADNEMGKLFVGARVPFISGSLNTPEGARNDSFQYRDVGVILEVTPHINNSEEVALKIRAESSNIRNGQTLFGGAILDTRNFKTDLLVKSGQTLVLGGIIQREDVDTVRKVPLLGSIPGLGWAFKKKDKISREIELMVFLRPKVTRTPEEALELLEEIERKAPHIKQWQDQSLPPAPPEPPKDQGS